jgi:hypothetical protein
MARSGDAWLEGQIARYLATGESDPWGQVEPAEDMFVGMKNYHRALRGALTAEVRKRSRRRRHPAVPDGMGTAFARRKLAPMVMGLFPASEHETVLGILEKSIVFLSRDAVLDAIAQVSFDSSAWQIANVYLTGVGAPPLDGETRVLGLSEETRCYVSLAYFEDENPFADYVVHEAAHIFHNAKREYLGLSYTRRREWMLDIDFCKRETFAYTCEVYSRVLEQSRSPAQRRALLDSYREDPIPGGEKVDTEEHLDILAEAVAARNGWKHILSRCAPAKRRHGSTLAPVANG